MTTSNFPRSFPRCVYHGTLLEHWDSIRREILIHRPHAKVNLDFGKGFYTTTNFQQAAERALHLQRNHSAQFPTQIHQGIVISFQLNSHLLYNVEEGEYRIFSSFDEEWAQFVVQNRLATAEHPAHSYRWTYGPLADGKASYLCNEFLAGRLRMSELIHGFFRKDGTWVQGLKPFQFEYDQLVFHDEWVQQVLTEPQMRFAVPPTMPNRR